MTPAFAAPEQITGAAITPATDIYAVGVLLYLLVAGRHPTLRDDQSVVETFEAIVNAEPLPAGAGPLDPIIARALRKTPHERHLSAAALAADLDSYLAQHTDG